MRGFTIVTDSCCDLPIATIKELKIPYVSLTYHYDSIERLDDFGTSHSLKDFYSDMRNGKMPMTSQPSSQSFYDVFKKILEEGTDILYIGVSSGISGTVNSAHVAKQMLEDDYLDFNIYIIDTLTASLGQGLLVLEAYKMQKQGSTASEIMDYLGNITQNLNTYMIVDDISYLRKGGRLSATAAFAGMLLNIKPFLTINNLGKAMPINKLRGKKKAISALFEKILERTDCPKEQIIAISHGDCINDALALKELITNKLNVKDIIINYVGPVVGTYGGPGALAVFFFGKERENSLKN